MFGAQNLVAALASAALVLGCHRPPGSIAHVQREATTAVECLAACEIDLTGDGEPDTVLYLRSDTGQRLVILVETAAGLSASSWRVREHGVENLLLTCRHGSTLWETQAGPGKRTRKEHRTPGAFVELSQPEGGAVAYYWNGHGFTEVWTAD